MNSIRLTKEYWDVVRKLVALDGITDLPTWTPEEIMILRDLGHFIGVIGPGPVVITDLK